jgi:NAD(P)H-hydrate epimerase
MSDDGSLYSASQVRELERRAIEDRGIGSSTLMGRAAAAVYRVLRARYPRARCIAVVCGPGNNGGDGVVLARLARGAGLETTVLTLGDARRAEVGARPFAASTLAGADVVVDALLGIGLTRAVQGEWRAAIESINQCGKPVLAVDIPSGLDAASGAVLGAAVRAAVTVSFIGLKAGLYTGAGRAHAGEILFDSLEVPADIYDGVAPLARRLREHELKSLIGRRARDAHKGSFGHVLVVGGGIGMAGAARLCGAGAYRAGAGLVTTATHPAHAATPGAERPELLAFPVRKATELKPLAARADAVALGPGLSQTAWGRSLWRAALASKRPLVVDADGLNLLAGTALKRNDWVLTPHPGEAARLLKTTTEKIQQDRFAAARALARRYGGVCVLKGSGTLVAAAGSDDIWLCDRGNPGMASGGSGDVLTGIIAALRVQGLAALDAARLGVWLHASAGDRAARSRGEIGLLASDVIAHVSDELNRIAV